MGRTPAATYQRSVNAILELLPPLDDDGRPQLSSPPPREDGESDGHYEDRLDVCRRDIVHAALDEFAKCRRAEWLEWNALPEVTRKRTPRPIKPGSAMINHLSGIKCQYWGTMPQPPYPFFMRKVGGVSVWKAAAAQQANRVERREDLDAKLARGRLQHDLRPMFEEAGRGLTDYQQRIIPAHRPYYVFICLTSTAGTREIEMLADGRVRFDDDTKELIMDLVKGSKQGFAKSCTADTDEWKAAYADFHKMERPATFLAQLRRYLRGEVLDKAQESGICKDLPALWAFKQAYDAHYAGCVAGTVTPHRLRDAYAAWQLAHQPGGDVDIAAAVRCSEVMGHKEGSAAGIHYIWVKQHPRLQLTQEPEPVAPQEAELQGPEPAPQEAAEPQEPEPKRRRLEGADAEEGGVISDELLARIGQLQRRWHALTEQLNAHREADTATMPDAAFGAHIMREEELDELQHTTLTELREAKEQCRRLTSALPAQRES